MIYKSPAVSVIIPTYNRACSIRRSVQSVLNQTFNDLEVIIIDDGSTDGTKKVLKDFSDKRIRYIRLKEAKGAAVARNIGIKIAVGKFVAFQDSDDEWLPKKLEKQISVFKHMPLGVGVVYSGFWSIKGEERVYKPSLGTIIKEGDIHDELFKGNFITVQSAVVRKECFIKAGMFDESLPRLQDWELWIRISKYYQFKYIDEPLVNVYYSLNSISSDQDALVRAHEIVLEKHFRDIGKNRQLLANRYYYVGKLLCKQKEVRHSRKYFLMALKSYPLNIKFFSVLFISFFGSIFCKKFITKLETFKDYLHAERHIKSTKVKSYKND